MVNRSVAWADWDEDLLALELQELNTSEFDLSLTGFNPKELDDLLALPDEEKANEVPAVPENPVSRAGDLWLCGKHRVLCGDSLRSADVSRLLGQRKPRLMVTDPPYGIELDSEWRDRAGLNGCGPAEASYMKHRTAGHTETTISGDTRAEVGSVRVGSKSPGCLRLARLEVHTRGSGRAAPNRLPASPADHLEQGQNGPHEDALLVPHARLDQAQVTLLRGAEKTG